MSRTITVYQSEGCGNTERAVALIGEYTAKIGLEVVVERVIVTTDAQVQEHRFLGSPTVRIGGLDVDPEARSATAYGFT